MPLQKIVINVSRAEEHRLVADLSVDPIRQLTSIEVGKDDVSEKQVNTTLAAQSLHHGSRLLAIGGFQHRITQAAQDVCSQAADGKFVFHIEDRFAPTRQRADLLAG